MTERVRGNEIGFTTRLVGRNVGLLRQDRGLSLEILSERLTSAGRPLNASSLSKLERGMRRIDLDDLVALAEVLGISLNQLMSTDEAWLLGRGFSFEVTGDLATVAAQVDEFDRLRQLEARIRQALAEFGDNDGEH